MSFPDKKDNSSSSNQASTSDSREDLLRRLSKNTANINDPITQTAEMYRGLSYLGRGIFHLKKAALWTNEKIIQPIMSVLPFLKPLGRWAWNSGHKFTHPSESFPRGILRSAHKKASWLSFGLIKAPETLPLGSFSMKRAGILALSGLFAASAGFNVPIVSEASRAAWEVPYNSVRMAVTMVFNNGHLHKEKFYTNGRTEIDPSHNLWSVTGCLKDKNCKPEDNVYIRFKPSIMHQAWSLANKHRFFIPDDVAGLVPQGNGYCEIEYYGVRWRLARLLQAFPVGLDVNCVSIGPNQPVPAMGSPVIPLPATPQPSEVAPDPTAPTPSPVPPAQEQTPTPMPGLISAPDAPAAVI